MRTVTGSVYSNTPTAHNPVYSASVPLSIYRDLAADLQAQHTTINELTFHNKQLVQENQILRQEIAKTVQSVLHLQKLLDSQNAATYRQVPHSYPDLSRETNLPVTDSHLYQQRQASSSPFIPPVNEILTHTPETFFIEEEEVDYYSPSDPETIDVSGWKLVVTILIIILMGFGAGYLIVRPFFDQHGR